MGRGLWVPVTIVLELLVVAVWAWEANRPRPVVLGSVPPTPTTIVGVHTRLTDEVEEVKLRRTMQMVGEMGAGWAVEFFPWAYIEPTKGSYDWRHADLVVSAANAAGITLIARLDFVPAWARPKDSTPRYLAEEQFADYARFVGAFAGRYRGSVRYIAIWNEPNTSLEWGFRPVDPAGYTRLLAAAYGAVKAANPEALVLPAGLAPTLERSDLALDDLVFAQRMYDAGAARYFDVMNVHAYGWTLPPDDPAGADKLNYARVEMVRRVMEANGDGGKPIIITEAGWNDSPRWAKAVRPGVRIEYTLRAYEKARTEWPEVLAVNVWAFRLPAPAQNYNDFYTLVDSEFQPRPIYTAIRNYATSPR